MTAEERIKELHNLKPPTKEHTQRKNVKIGVILFSFACISVLSFIYALVQQLEARKQETIATHLMEQKLTVEQQLVVALEEANRQSAEAHHQQQLAAEALKACASSHKKSDK